MKKLLFIFIFLISVLSFSSCGNKNDNNSYKIYYEKRYDGEGKLSCYSVLRVEGNKAKEITIPESYDDGNGLLPVKYLNDGAFNGFSKLEKINLPDSIESIGKRCFANCTSLEEFNNPKRLTWIKEGAFLNCTSLKSFIIPDWVETISENTFMNCLSLEEVKLQNERESVDLTKIENKAFYNCKSLRSIELPNTLESIGEYAFYNNFKLHSFTLPESLNELGKNSFKNCIIVNLTNNSSLYETTIIDSKITTYKGQFDDGELIIKDDFIFISLF